MELKEQNNNLLVEENHSEDNKQVSLEIQDECKQSSEQEVPPQSDPAQNPYLEEINSDQEQPSQKEEQKEESKEEQKEELKQQEEAKIQSPEEAEMLKYLEEMLLMITTPDEEFNKKNMEMLTEQIYNGLKRTQKRSKEKMPEIPREHVKMFLEELRGEQQRIMKEEGHVSPERLLQVFREQQSKDGSSGLNKSDLFTIGAKGYSATTIWMYTAPISSSSVKSFTAGYLGSTTWITAGLFYTAQTGLNYRRLKKGDITKKEFWRRMKLNSVTAVSSLAVGTGGAAAGFAIGSLIFPGVGSIIGAVIGGVAGGIAGEKLSTKFYLQVENRIEEAKRLRELEEQVALTNPVSQERLNQALGIFGLEQYNPHDGHHITLAEVEERYLEVTERIGKQKADTEAYVAEQQQQPSSNDPQQETQQQEESQDFQYARQLQFLEQMEQVCSSFEDIKEYLEYREQLGVKAQEIKEEEEEEEEIMEPEVSQGESGVEEERKEQKKSIWQKLKFF